MQIYNNTENKERVRLKYNQGFKRLFDLILALVGLVILCPLFLFIAAAIKVDSKEPVFFKQKRFGKNKKFFYILKFRTMRTDAPKDTPTHLFSNPDDYITGVGRILRKTSLDELPQLINILLAQMSVVGPRPALWNQYDLIAQRDQYNANSIAPGLTGWAQINGRDALSIEEKAKLDGEYVDKVSFLFDMKVVFLTAFKSAMRSRWSDGEQLTLTEERKGS